jgi:hypothetical protein
LGVSQGSATAVFVVDVLNGCEYGAADCSLSATAAEAGEYLDLFMVVEGRRDVQNINMS